MSGRQRWGYVTPEHCAVQISAERIVRGLLLRAVLFAAGLGSPRGSTTPAVGCSRRIQTLSLTFHVVVSPQYLHQTAQGFFLSHWESLFIALANQCGCLQGQKGVRFLYFYWWSCIEAFVCGKQLSLVAPCTNWAWWSRHWILCWVCFVEFHWT